ncbi:MAG: type II toxin-antitoxin system RelE/ParE family toxin [Candidatus Heimdallarchaeota archaeon]
MSSKNPKRREYKVYLLLPVVDKELKKLPKNIQKQIMDIIHSLKFPFQVPAIRMRNKKNTYRAKTGNYRILYKIYIKEVIVVIIRISHRKKAYR